MPQSDDDVAKQVDEIAQKGLANLRAQAEREKKARDAASGVEKRNPAKPPRRAGSESTKPEEGKKGGLFRRR